MGGDRRVKKCNVNRQVREPESKELGIMKEWVITFEYEYEWFVEERPYPVPEKVRTHSSALNILRRL